MADGHMVKQFQQGQVIFKEGQPAERAYLVRKGSVSIFRVVDDQRIVLARMGPGRLFGEMGPLTESLRDSNAICDEFTELVVLEKEHLLKAMAAAPIIVRNMLEAMIERLKATTQRLSTNSRPDTFMSLVKVLEMAVRAGGDSLSLAAFVRQAKDVLNLTQLEVEEQLKKLAKVGAIKIERGRGSGAQLRDATLQVADVDALTRVAKGVNEMVKEQENGAVSSGREYLDFSDFAQELETTPEILARKVGAGEIPLRLLFLPEGPARAFAQEMGKQFFKGTRKLTSRLAELTVVDDLINVDAATLQQVFGQIGHFKVGVLLQAASAEARQHMMKVLSGRAAQMAIDEAGPLNRLGADDVADAEFEAINLVKKLKGISTQG